ncbi:rRNA methyltransferase, partial [Reticulomyxa filosa]
NYLAPKKIDPRLLDPKFVFHEVEEKQESISVMRQRKKKNAKAPRVGYDQEYLLHKKTSVLDFLNSDVPEAILGDFHQFDFDDKQECKLCLSHKQTTEEIQCLLKDLRVLGKSDFRKLLRWRLKMKKFLEQVMPKDEKSQDDKDKADADAKEGLKLVCFCYYNTYMYIHIYLYIYMYVTFGKQMGVVVKKMKIEEELDAEEDTKIREEVRNLVEKKKKDDRKKKRKIRQAKIKSTRLMLMGGIKPDD